MVYGKGTRHEQTFWTGTVADYPGIDARNPMFDSVFSIPVSTEMLMHHKDSEVDGVESSNPHSSEATASSRSLSPSKSMRSVMSMARKPLSFSKKVTNGNDIEMTLIDVNGSNRELGSITITHKELVETHNHLTETRPIGSKGAKIEFQISLSGILSEEDSCLDINEVDASERGNMKLYDGEEDSQKVLLTALRGRGFVIHKRGFGKKDDVPDMYLSLPQLDWKTSVIKDDTQPQWNESKVFTTRRNARDIIRVDAYDKNSKSKDEYIGTAKFPLDQMLRKRIMEVEILNGTEGTSSYVTMKCVHRTASTPVTDDKTDDEVLNDDVATPLLSLSAPPVLSLPKFDTDKDNSIANDTMDTRTSTSSREKMFRSKSLPSPKVRAFVRSLSARKANVQHTLDQPG